MVGIAQVLVIAERMRSWEIHLRAITACLPLFVAAGHPNYLKSARLYLQKMHTLEDKIPRLFTSSSLGSMSLEAAANTVLALALIL